MARRLFPLILCVLGLRLGIGSAVEVADIHQLKAGDIGTCITEVENGELLEFPISVVGVLGGAGPDGDRVLIRLEHPRFEHTGVAAGMSGSPVYVGGRLVGALAFAWGFAKEPIAGVTPFSQMQTIGEGSASPSASPAGGRPSMVEILEARNENRLPQAVVDWLLPESGSGAPVSMVVGLGGIAGNTGNQPQWIEDAWRRLGWVSSPISAAGNSGDAGPSEPLRPGSMIAGVLVDGDAHMAAGGTVTEVRGDQIWAFGHPFYGTGETEIPLAYADVVTIMPSLFNSFKVFNVGEITGTLLADRAHGVWGMVGDAPSMIPLEVTALGRSYSFRVLDNRVMTPLLSSFLVFASQSVRGGVLGPQIVNLRTEVSFADGERVELDQVFEGADAPAQAAAWTSAVLAYLAASPFPSPDTSEILVDFALDARRRSAEILDIVPDRWAVSPGERLGIRVRWREEDGTVSQTRFEAVVPEELADGRVDLVVADGSTWSYYDLMARPHVSASFSDELGLLRRLRNSRALVAAFEGRGSSVVLAGGTVPFPEGLVTSLRSALGRSVETAAFRVLGIHEEDLGMPISGAARISLAVKRREK